MSVYDWYWDNYEKGMDWLNHHEVAFWKSQAIAYKAENACLKDKIKSDKSTGGPVPKKKRQTAYRTKKRHLKALKKTKRRQEVTVSEEAPSEDFEFEVSPEMIEFFKISMKHRAQRRKEKEERDALTSFVPPQDIVDARIKEMKTLYGEGSSKIIELEKAMTLRYEKFVDRKCPEYWPKLPLNLHPA